MTFEQRPHEVKERKNNNIWEKKTLSKGNSKCKGPKVGSVSGMFKNSKETSVAKVRELVAGNDSEEGAGPCGTL